jgi:hypothetical protein
LTKSNNVEFDLSINILKMKKLIFISNLLLIAISINAQEKDFPKLTGQYLCQKPPRDKPEPFAPDIIFSDNAIHGHIAVTPDGNEIYWIFLCPDYSKKPPTIKVVKKINGIWSEPIEMGFSKPYGVYNFSLSPDGERIYFHSNRPVSDQGVSQTAPTRFEDYKIWYVERQSSGWGLPKLLDQSINHNIRGVSVTNDGTLYTHGIKRSTMKNGHYTEWETLPEPLNIITILGGNPFISPDESYILFNRKWSGESGYGICISYHLKDDGWTQPVNLLEKQRVDRGGSQPYVTPDGKYMFYYSGGKFFWMSAEIIDVLKPKE